MPTQAVTFERFGGINVADDELEVGATAATDAVNVDFDRLGTVRTRQGYVNVVSPTATAGNGFAPFEKTGSHQFVVGYNNGGTHTYAGYLSTGGAAIVTATPAYSGMSAVQWGNISTEYLYIANGIEALWRYDGNAFAQPAGAPAATHLGVTALSNRLVAGGITGTSVSRVMFSDAGDPGTWSVNNFVELAPGDGSGITGIATWQESLIVFKRERFFVFYNESVDADGEPIFNYRPVDGFGSIIPPVTGDEGVYFFDGKTVWLTAGGAPRSISRNVERFISGATALDSAFVGYTVDQDDLTDARLSYADNRLYLSLFTTVGTVIVLVYDPQVDAWTLYSTPLRFAADLRRSVADSPTVFWAGSDAKVNEFQASATQDAGVAFNWQYTSGFFTLSDPGQTAVTLESRAWGIGTATLKVWTDYAQAFDTGSSLVLGSSAPGDAWQQIDREGTLFMYRLQGNTSPAAVHRLAHYILAVKPVGVE